MADKRSIVSLRGVYGKVRETNHHLMMEQKMREVCKHELLLIFALGLFFSHLLQSVRFDTGRLLLAAPVSYMPQRPLSDRDTL